MRIKLVGALPRELKDMGFEPGNQFDAAPAVNTRLNAVQVRIQKDGEIQVATIYPENYKKI